MKINALVITDHNYNNKGNIVLGLQKLSSLMKQNGDSMTWLFTPHVRNCPWTKDLENCYFLTDDKKENKRLISLISAKHNINVIHTHFCTSDILCNVRLFCLAHKNVKFVRHMHMLYFPKTNVLAEKAKQILSFGDVNVACSPMCADTMEKVGIKNVVTVTNGVDFDSLSQVRKSYGGIHILLFGYNYVNKGVKIAIQGTKMLSNPDVHLDICVAGDLEAVKTWIKKDFGEIPDFVSFVSPSDNVSELYANADIFLSSGNIESYCFAVREALYCGCRVVVSDIPSQIMHCGEVSFKRDDPKGLSEALKTAINMPFDPQKNAERVKNNSVSIDAWAENMYEVYEKAVAE